MFDFTQEAQALAAHATVTEHVTPLGVIYESRCITTNTARWYEQMLSQTGNDFGFEEREGLRIARRVIGMAQAALDRANAVARRKAFDEDRKVIIMKFARHSADMGPNAA